MSNEIEILSAITIGSDYIRSDNSEEKLNKAKEDFMSFFYEGV